MDKKTRRGIAAAFRAAKPRLWDGKSEHHLKHVRQLYICHALEDAKKPYSKEAIGIVMSRIHPRETLGQWLTQNGVPWYTQTRENTQAHRHAWLDLLIKEFES